MGKKLRVRNHKVVLNRSRGGDAGITFFLTILGIFMFIPMYYAVIQSLKPLDELWMYPPRFYVSNPTLSNFSLMFKTLQTSWVPFSRYIFNTVLISVAGTFGNLLFGSLAAYAISKINFPGRKLLSTLVRLSLMFHATVATIVNFMTMSALGWIDTYLSIIVPAWGATLGMYLMQTFMESNIQD
ncbi:MAG: carbohydrate ABC transporter permease, partial [Eubacteriales bacterium]